MVWWVLLGGVVGAVGVVRWMLLGWYEGCF